MVNERNAIGKDCDCAVIGNRFKLLRKFVLISRTQITQKKNYREPEQQNHQKKNSRASEEFGEKSRSSDSQKGKQ